MECCHACDAEKFRFVLNTWANCSSTFAIEFLDLAFPRDSLNGMRNLCQNRGIMTVWMVNKADASIRTWHCVSLNMSLPGQCVWKTCQIIRWNKMPFWEFRPQCVYDQNPFIK